jgi:flagellar FliL protein
MATNPTKTAKTVSKTDPKAPVKDAAGTDAKEAAAPPKKKRSLLKILLLLALVLGGAGGGAWYFLKDDQSAANGKPGAAKAATAKAVPLKAPVFATLEPFTVNLQHEDASPQYLQVGLALKVADAVVVDAVKLHTPEIRNRVLLLLSGKKASEISTSEGKQSLSKELMREIGQPLAGSVPAAGIDSVLFTSFVIQ